MDDTGAVFDTTVRDGWGQTITGSTGERYGFAQRELDTESGLVYMRHRMYDPRTGRFTQTDPLVWARPSQHYTYAGNMPTIAKDPTGEFLWLVAVVTAAAVFFPAQNLDSPSGPTWDPKEVNSAYVSIATAPVGGGLIGKPTQLVVGGGLKSLGLKSAAGPLSRIAGASASGATSAEIGLFAERGIVEGRLPTREEMIWSAIVGGGIGAGGQAGGEAWQAWRAPRNTPALTVKPSEAPTTTAPAAKAQQPLLVGLSDQEATGMGNYLKSLKTADGRQVITNVEAYGSRAGSTYRGRGPTPTSDLDILVTVRDGIRSDELRALMNEVQDLADIMKKVKGFDFNFQIFLETEAAGVKSGLKQTPFVELGNK